MQVFMAIEPLVKHVLSNTIIEESKPLLQILNKLFIANFQSLDPVIGQVDSMMGFDFSQTSEINLENFFINFISKLSEEDPFVGNIF